MKNQLLLLLCLLPFTGIAQTKEPEFLGSVLYKNSDNSFVYLEQKEATVKSKGLSRNWNFIIEGCCSSVRVDSLNLNFSVKVNDFNINPTQYILVVPLVQGKDKRTVDNSTNSVQYKFEKVGSSSIQISIDRLPKGQYAITFKDTYLFNLFYVE